MKKHTIIISILYFFLVGPVVAQKNKQKAAAANTNLPAVQLKSSIRVFARAYGDSIVLRWGPTADWAWTSLNYNGYAIERIDLTEAKHPKKEILTLQPLKPLPLEQLKSRFGSDNKLADIAAQCLYGKNFSLNLRKGQAGVQDKSDVYNNRFAFALQVADYDGEVAKAEALRFTDRKIQKDGIYIYRVYPAHLPSQGKIDTGNVMIQNTRQPGKSKPQLQEAISRDRFAEIHWNRAQQEQYTGYFVERSADGKAFNQLTPLPYFSVRPDSAMNNADSSHAKLFAMLKEEHVFVDSLPQNYHHYYYRVRGINAFAEISDYSDTLNAMGTDQTPPTLAILETPKFVGDRKIQLHWKKQIKEGDFKGYYVTRAHSAGGPYLTITPKLLDPSITQFTDTAAFAHGQNYYIIAAVDTAGNLGPSIPAMGLVPDKTPPGVPKGLKGFIEKNGLVHLSWNKNTDEDLKGYKVYFANSNEHIFSQITISPTTDTTFTDSITLRTLTENIWYKVVAVDENNNHSDYSPAVKLKRPDIIPPVPPLALKVGVDTSGVQVDWIQSSSEDVVGYIIYRKEKNTNWEPIGRVKHDSTKKTFHFKDGTLKPFHEYNYCAEAIDDDSLHSTKSTMISAAIKTAPDLPALKTLVANWDDKAKQVRLRWQFTDKGNYFFVLYKATGNEALTKFHSEASTSEQYTDNDLPGASGIVRYAIQVVYKDQRGRTKVSDPVNVNINSKQ